VIKPYKRPPARKPIGLLGSNRLVLCEDGRHRKLSNVDAGATIYTDGLVAGRLAHRADGEVIYWNSTPIRWVAEREVVILPNYPGTTPDVMAGLVDVHDLLETYDAAGASLASCSASLLRATVQDSIFTGGGPYAPHLVEVIGGRQASAQPPGHFGRFQHVDLSAAYARTLGEMTYDGYYVDLRTDALPEASSGRGVFVRARVYVPADVRFGPLPRRHRTRPSAESWARLLNDREYPRGAQLSSTWTLEEVRNARAVGCGVEVRQVVMDIPRRDADRRPFYPWWQAIERFRALDGWGGVFGKMMGNALWGRFAMLSGERRQVAWDGDNRVVKNKRLPAIGRHSDAYDVAELVAGRVRARLYDDVMVPYADRLISVHTDGALLYPGPLKLPADWRLKIDGRELIYLGPQSWAYRGDDGAMIYKVAGVPPRHVRRAFAEMTRDTLRGGADRPKFQPREDAWTQLMLDVPA
jgi:hypothetical protein